MTFKEFRRTAAKATIWIIIFMMGALMITVHFDIPDPATIKEQEYGLIMGCFVGLMASNARLVFPFSNKKAQENIN